jgi:hypothetical protein
MASEMEPARRFAWHRGRTILCDIDHLEDALQGRAGTRIVPDPLQADLSPTTRDGIGMR